MSEKLRLDVLVHQQYPAITRSKAGKLIEKGHVQVCGVVVIRPGARYDSKAAITVNLPEEQTEPEPKEMVLSIIYEDASLAVIDKERGMVVHPAPGHREDTLVNGLLHQFAHLSDVGGKDRPGIVHRIDKETSGLLIVAKDNETHLALKAQLEDKTLNREYLCICKGRFREREFEVERPIGRHPVDRKRMAVVEGGREAKTMFCVLDQNDNYALLLCKLTTGRTHQIRVHLSSIGHSIVGDTVYGKAGRIHFEGQALHAFKLCFVHPKTRETMRFFAPIPQDFAALAKKCKLKLPNM